MLYSTKVVFLSGTCTLMGKWIFPHQQRLRAEIGELDYSANQVRQNKSQAENEIKRKKSFMMQNKER